MNTILLVASILFSTLIIVALVKAKISPLAGVIYIFFALIIGVGGSWVCSDWLNPSKDKSERSTDEINEPDVVFDNPLVEDSPGGLEEQKESTERIIKRNYKVTDPKFWTYSTNGDWTWSEEFVQEFAKQTGWQYEIINGNYSFTVNHNGRITKGAFNGEQSYILTSGQLDILVNDVPCCCQGKLKLSDGIRGRNMAELKSQIQIAITSLVMEQKEIIIKEMVQCLQ